MKRAPRSRQRHDLYAKYHDYDSEISDLLGECGFVYLAIVFALTRFQWFGALPVVGSGIFLILGAAMSFFFKRDSGNSYASLAEPIFMVLLGGGVIAYYYHVRSKNQNSQDIGEHQ